MTASGAPIQQWGKRTTLNFALTFLTDRCTKGARNFSKNELLHFLLEYFEKILKSILHENEK